MADMMDIRRRIIAAQPHLETAYSGNNDDVEAIAHFRTDMELPFTQLKVDIPLTQDGTGTPSPDNVRNISGRSSVKVTRTGINLLQCDTFTSGTQKGVRYTRHNNADGEIDYISVSGTANDENAFRNLNYEVGKLKWPPLPGKYSTYAYTEKAIVCFCLTYDAVTDITEKKHIETIGKWKTYSLTSYGSNTSAWFRIQLMPYYATDTVYNDEIRPLVCLASDAGCEYEPYKGSTYTIDLPETVYGGTLDLLNGTLTVTHLMDTYRWGDMIARTTWTNCQMRTARKTALGADTYAVCNMAPYIYRYTLDSPHAYLGNTADLDWGVFCCLPNDTPSDTEIQIYYELATPITYQLTPMTIRTLRGVNNVWSDAGTTTVSYWSH